MNERYLIPDLSLLSENSTPETTIFRMEREIKRSRFITSLGRAGDRRQAKVFIDYIRAEFPNATHNCWAYAAGKPGDSAEIGQSDDGEPHGTAGRPMLNQLLHGQVGEIVAVVTRYFGGVKLGTGGLVRAYQGCVAEALEALPVVEKVIPVMLRVTLEYSRVNPLYRILTDFEARIIEEFFSDLAEFVIELPQDKAEAFRAALAQATDGRAEIGQTVLKPAHNTSIHSSKSSLL